MSTMSSIDKMRQDQRRIEEILLGLEAQKKEIDEKYNAVLEEENMALDELRRCRDQVQYTRLDMKLNMVSRRRREMDPQKQAIERKIRGHREELERIKARIGYMTPKGGLVSSKEE